jgi:hypothetical protein
MGWAIGGAVLIMLLSLSDFYRALHATEIRRECAE